ncbi:hypothetical protein GH733_001060, partial [Mirounga leonina]
MEQIEKELLRVAQILKEPKMAGSIKNPCVKHTVKMKRLNDMTANETFSPLMSSLINLLAENGCLNNIPGVISAFSTMVIIHRGEVPCNLEELPKSKGQVSKLEVKIDLSSMGAMIVHIGEKYADIS